jgi:hypothetical protein
MASAPAWLPIVQDAQISTEIMYKKRDLARLLSDTLNVRIWAWLDRRGCVLRAAWPATAYRAID